MPFSEQILQFKIPSQGQVLPDKTTAEMLRAELQRAPLATAKQHLISILYRAVKEFNAAGAWG
jgi:hypothetical protein